MNEIQACAMPLLKARLNRSDSDCSIDTLLFAVLGAAETELSSESGDLDSENAADMMLLVDTAVWNYQSRDKATGMPEWLRYKRRQRFLRLRGTT